MHKLVLKILLLIAIVCSSYFAFLHLKAYLHTQKLTKAKIISSEYADIMPVEERFADSQQAYTDFAYTNEDISIFLDKELQLDKASNRYSAANEEGEMEAFLMFSKLPSNPLEMLPDSNIDIKWNHCQNFYTDMLNANSMNLGIFQPTSELAKNTLLNLEKNKFMKITPLDGEIKSYLKDQTNIYVFYGNNSNNKPIANYLVLNKDSCYLITYYEENLDEVKTTTVAKSINFQQTNNQYK